MEHNAKINESNVQVDCYEKQEKSEKDRGSYNVSIIFQLQFIPLKKKKWKKPNFRVLYCIKHNKKSAA